MSMEDKIRFDDASRRLLLVSQNKTYVYDDLRGYALEEENRAGKGFARVYSLGILSGDGVRSVSALCIRLLFVDGEERIDLLITPTKTNSIVYKALSRTANEIMDRLHSICPQNCLKAGGGDYDAELRRLRALADDGVITEADFAAKKKQLLGI